MTAAFLRLQFERGKHEKEDGILDSARCGDQTRRNIDERLCEAACACGEEFVSLATQINGAAAVIAKANDGGAFVALRVAEPVIGHTASECTLMLCSGMRLEMTTLPAPEWLAALGRATQGVR